MFLDKLFSVKTVKNPGEICHKEIYLVGLKMKFISVKDEINAASQIINNSTLFIAYEALKQASPKDLFVLKNDCVVYILSSKCALVEFAFFKDYLLPFGYSSKLLKFQKLEKTSNIYKEHFEKLKKQEYLWKYLNKEQTIEQKYFTYNEEKQECNINTINPDKSVSSRKYIKGITIGEYIKNKTFSEQLQILEKTFEYLFSNFPAEDDLEKVSMYLSDCHLYNILLGEDGNLHYIDYDDRFKESLDRSFCIYNALYNYNRILYNKLLKIFDTLFFEYTQKKELRI